MKGGPIAYMAKNHVAANILMLFFIIGGILVARDVKQEVFPEFELDMVTVQVVYPGATPAEVEDAIIRPVELALSGVDNVKKITSTASESVGSVVLEVMEGGDADQVLQDAKAEVDRIRTFPEEAEKPVTSKVTNRRNVMNLMVYGDASERSLMENAERVRDDLLAKDGITQVELSGYRPYEISIEISEENLRKYNLTLPRVSQIIQQASLDMAGGAIKAEGGEVLIRTTEKRYYGTEFDSIAVFTFPTGEKVLLKDVATVIDGFQEADQSALFDGKPGIMVNVYRVGTQKPKDISKIVREYIDQRNDELPDSVKIAVWEDWSIILNQRLNLLLRNGMLGLALVLLTLGFFLEVRLALWVAAGIAISFLGSMLLMPITDVSINMMSLFAYLIILGVVVDDAIVVGENIFVHTRRKKPLYQASVDGTREVNMAVVFAGLTTIAAFGPLMFISSTMGKFMRVVPLIVVSVLILSLIEAFFILPSHLNGRLVASKAKFWTSIEKKRSKNDKYVNWMIDKLYAGTLRWAVNNRYLTLSISIAILIITIGLFAGGYIKFTFMPDIDSDAVTVSLTMPQGTSYEETKKWAEEIQTIGMELIKESDKTRTDGKSNLKHIYTLIGQQAMGGGGPGGGGVNLSTNLAQINMLMKEPEERNISTIEFATLWRDKVGEIPGVESLTFSSDMMSRGADIEIQLSHSDFNVLIKAVDRLKEALGDFAGTGEISDTYSEGKREMKIRLRPEAQSLGITERELALQIRGAFYGTEALRIQRGMNEVKVMVRYPEDDRRTLASIENMHIRTSTGKEIPLLEAAYVDEGRGFSVINRTDRRRVVNVTAKVNKRVANTNEIMAELRSGVLKEIMSDYPGLTYDLEGRSRSQRESMQGVFGAFIVGLILIYALLAIPFKSFGQPFIVMSAIPFGVVGAIGGHMLLGYSLSMISAFGIVALNGVVVNSSLVLIDFINKARAEGIDTVQAVYEAGKRRFRPIIMTALTTFFGLSPMILETEIQARFLVPMAISLGFGVLFATAITLVLIPALYMIFEDYKRIGARVGGFLTSTFFPQEEEVSEQQ